MLRNGNKTLQVFFILQVFIGFIVNVFTQSLEVSLEFGTKEEQDIIETLNGEQNAVKVDGGNDQQLNEENVGEHFNHVSEEQFNVHSKEHLNVVSEEHSNPDIVGGQHQNLNVVSEEKFNFDIIDEHENLNVVSDKHSNLGNKISQVKKSKPPSWKFKDETDKNEEPGFDLTSEEIEKFKIWKDGIIPYYIDVVSFGDKVFRDKIRNYLQMVNSATSLNFVELFKPPAEDNERWVFFMNRRGRLECADHTVKNFTNQGVQKVVLGYDCIATKGELAEAVMSIAGVPAQHNAPDRDKYIKVKMENIMPDKIHLFEKLSDDDWLFHDLPYDFNSITHYDILKYSSNGHATIEFKNTSEDLSPATAFSTTDLLKIKMLYNYITKNKKLQTAACKQLFKPSNKYLASNPSPQNQVKPRKKPSKYLGIADGEDDEITEQTKEDDNEDENNNNEGGRHDDSKDDDVQNEKTYKSKERENHDNLPNSLKQQSEKANKETAKHGHNTKLIAKKNIDPLALLSDYDSSANIQKLSFKLPSKPKVDLLSLLSDYQTGDERDRK